jgi:L-alanine-DL-glutamate epimerase-like enolase superfamily enzyme
MGRVRGWGEAAIEDDSEAAVIGLLEQHRVAISRYAFTDPQRFWHFLHHLLPGQSAVVCALDIAGWDLFASMRNLPLFKLLRLKHNYRLQSSVTIKLGDEGAMKAQIDALPKTTCLVDIHSAGDLALLKTLRNLTIDPIRVDAGQNLSAAEAVDMLPALEQMGVELLIDPVAAHDAEGAKQLKAAGSRLRLLSSKSLSSAEDAGRLAEGYHGVCLSLSAISGLSPAMQQIGLVKKSGLMIKLDARRAGTIGTAAVGHLMALADFVAADGPLRYAQDVATGVSYHGANLRLSESPGLGVVYQGALQDTRLIP